MPSHFIYCVQQSQTFFRSTNLIEPNFVRAAQIKVNNSIWIGIKQTANGVLGKASIQRNFDSSKPNLVVF